LEREYTLFNLLKRPSVRYADLQALTTTGTSEAGSADPQPADPEVVRQVEIAAKYDGYIARQKVEVARHESHETTTIPESIDYSAVRGLSVEVRQKLGAHRPATVGQASRISGVTPAAISLLLVHLKRLRRPAGPDDAAHTEAAEGDPSAGRRRAA
jgi:tRNA uridine 5-carboxymethylaminomethyl modification enzyme